MKYIIMCGGRYDAWNYPKQLASINGEVLVERTIRLLRECGATDIAISSNDDRFEAFGVPVLRHNNGYTAHGYNDYDGYWCDAFYPTDEPCCYIYGDVFFSPHAIRTIVGYETDDIMLFGSKPPFSVHYPKPYVEPFAFKVQNQKHLHEAIAEVKRLDSIGAFKRKPISWELWNVICGADPNKYNKRYIAINDYTSDVDTPEEAEKLDKHYRTILER